MLVLAKLTVSAMVRIFGGGEGRLQTTVYNCNSTAVIASLSRVGPASVGLECRIVSQRSLSLGERTPAPPLAATAKAFPNAILLGFSCSSSRPGSIRVKKSGPGFWQSALGDPRGPGSQSVSPTRGSNASRSHLFYKTRSLCERRL